MTRRVLFVDDEPRILEGLRRLLRPLRDQWDMVFAEGGAPALAELTAAPVDVVVSDMRMPGMDGGQLLEQVAALSPATIRIVLSGQTDDQAASRIVPVAHQFLMKPCDPETLRDVIERACALRDLLGDPILRETVGAIESLPPVPGVYLALGRALSNPESSLDDIAGVVERDAALTAKVLQLVNSSFFGQRREVSSVRQACALLGTGLIRSLGLAHEVFAPGSWRVEGLSLEREQAHAVRVAALARAMLPDPVAGEAAVAAGLMHDLGKLILASRAPAAFARHVAQSREQSRPLYRLELDHCGVSHAEVGACLLGLWGLPHEVVEAVAHHHLPGRVPAGDHRVLAAVHLADALVRQAQGDPAGEVHPESVALLGGPERLDDWRALAAREEEA